MRRLDLVSRQLLLPGRPHAQLLAPSVSVGVCGGSGSLTATQREQYYATGCLFPIRGLPTSEAASMLDRLAAFEAERGLVASDVIRNKGHLKLLWVYELVHHPVLLDAVESIIGPDILCWGSSLFIKDAGEEKTVAWHQDSYYWDIGTTNVCTLWIAFAPSTIDNGALQVLPGTHLGHIREHGPSPDGSSNMIYNVGGTYREECTELPPGASQSFEPGAGGAQQVLLEPGEFALFHNNIVHGSPPNHAAGGRRAGLGIRYCATSCKPGPAAASRKATLVRGTDTFHHFKPDPVPTADMDEDLVSLLDIGTVTPSNRNSGVD